MLNVASPYRSGKWQLPTKPLRRRAAAKIQS
ncbi:predicted protein [Chaetomium globosum CBS 148.51]|uniref:Uncharacterized protein n=1 Tax=Chaetomium globosum (strain ATCC 6205 / CBS 148.51 / DSM 1962 / NBRC 6347 / NRRL 1970) TaxID=306901 RepID=Q2HEP7_CHAGB|nr:uncharacterized protein CHGG_01307 [Chaetomium globosum CBS 148.51]EAQ93072.1 predicted protein [Chaetomium globosum CBS 148.51]